MEFNIQEIKLIKDFGVRALLSYTIVTGYIIMMMAGVYNANEKILESIMSMYTPIVMAVILFYFHSSELKQN